MSTTQTQSEKTPQVYSPPYPYLQHNPDEINLLEYIYALVKHKWWIIGAVTLGLVVGFVIAIIKGPTWTSEVIIAPKESDMQTTPNLSGLGAFGGIVASQLNIAGSPGLDKIELILDSRKFSAEVIERYDLLPFIYKISWPDKYKDFYDSLKRTWSADFVPPNFLRIGGHIKKEYFTKETNKNNTMSLQFKSSDSLFSDTLLSLYLIYLNDYIKTSVLAEAKENVAYLENQLITVSDPLLREKFQGMIASEVEKTMLVSKEAFKIVDPQLTLKKHKEKMLYPIAIGFAMFFITTLVLVFFHVMTSGKKTEEDEKLIRGIKRELTRI